ncbi:hypothetical protein AAFC00_006957 [Neodothiora populina]|uniref:Tetratricopeptide repeat domain-containing protein n=1 Tax=Neodothiora populina TaxID=2781224 RepID=A0ABR3PC01_9PEZI
MVFVKPTVGLHRLAVTAFKSFNHGVAGALVAASQSSNASQNTATHPKAYLNRLGKGDKGSQNGLHATHSALTGRVESADHDSSLAQYYDAWQKHQKNGEVRDLQQFHFQKRLQDSSAADADAQERADVEGAVLDDGLEEVELLQERGALKRSYTTSAVDNFSKAIDNDAVEALAFAQVNEAIAEEVSKSKQEAEAAAGIELSDVREEDDAASEKTVTLHDASSNQREAVDATRSRASRAVSAHAELYAEQLYDLIRTGQHAKVPGYFEAMLRSGVTQPSPLAYRALMSSAIELTTGKHQKVPRVLEVFSDMLRRSVVPDAETYAMLVDSLAVRALDASATKQTLEERASRYGPQGSGDSFLFRSDALEYAIFSEDQSLSIALSAYNSANSSVRFSGQSYTLLITACAKQRRLSDMIRLYEHMSGDEVVPSSDVFPAMIKAFGSVGDLRNAVEAYDEYKALAIANNSGLNNIERMDDQVYAALIHAYASSQDLVGAKKFMSQIEAAEGNDLKREAVRDTLIAEAFLPAVLKAGDFDVAFEMTAQLSRKSSALALTRMTLTTADGNNRAISTKAFNALAKNDVDLAPAAMAMLAMHLRNASLDAAEPFWRVLENSTATYSFIEPSTMLALAFISIGHAERGLYQTRQMWSKVRQGQSSESTEAEISERIEEAIELLGQSAIESGKPLRVEASLELLRMMVENGGLVHGLAEHLVASLGPEHISRLLPADICLLTKIQSRLILDESAPEIAGPARFACLLETIVSRSILPDVSTEDLIEKTLINIDHSDLSRIWNSYRYPVSHPASALGFSPLAPFAPYQAPPPPAPVQPVYDDTFDPYAGQTDNKGSVAITDLLEKSQGKSAATLTEALTKFRNIRRAGRHPRFFAYAKLITASAKENQLDLAHDILEMAKRDVPYVPQYRVVRHGWVTILDSMLAACLVAGRRDLAARYHQDLLDMGAAPCANTYGLYITTLKESTKTFDEASEAVKIFLRAKSEGVEPSSFLYNALIGKLGKARRIDDCLFYFAEMRHLGVRPTSVTYGTIVNALCRVSDDKFAEEIFEEMESCANYKPRPAPYHSLMQYFLTTKRDRSKVLSYYERMLSKGIRPTMHTYKLLIDAHATLEPINMAAGEQVLEQMRAAGDYPEAVHFASLIHAKGCVQHDMEGARALFDSVLADTRIRLQPCLYQALFESLVANHQVGDAGRYLADMAKRRVEMTPYIANALIHGWTLEKDISRAEQAYARVSLVHREPSTYEAMIRAYLAVQDRDGAAQVAKEALSRGYPAAVSTKIAELLGGGRV